MRKFLLLMAVMSMGLVSTNTTKLYAADLLVRVKVIEGISLTPCSGAQVTLSVTTSLATYSVNKTYKTFANSNGIAEFKVTVPPGAITAPLLTGIATWTSPTTGFQKTGVGVAAGPASISGRALVDVYVF